MSTESSNCEAADSVSVEIPIATSCSCRYVDCVLQVHMASARIGSQDQVLQWVRVEREILGVARRPLECR